MLVGHIGYDQYGFQTASHLVDKKNKINEFSGQFQKQIIRNINPRKAEEIH